MKSYWSDTVLVKQPVSGVAYLAMKNGIRRTIWDRSKSLFVPSNTETLLRQIRRWLLLIALLLGIGIVTLAHTGYILTVTSLLYWQSLVFSAAGVIGGVIAFVAGIQIIRSFFSPKDPSSE